MIAYGAAPAADEVEVTLFGPGYGEALAVHLGGGAWLLADSCLNPQSGRPAALDYLQQLGVSPDQVRVIVATHWHDDHVRGIGQLAAHHPTADFVVSSVFNEKEAATYLAAYSGIAATGQSRGTRELFDVVRQRSVTHALHRSLVFEEIIDERPIRVTALSPVQAAFAQSIAHIAQYLPGIDQPINHAPPGLKPNIESIVLHIDLGDDAILLGTDLEEHAACGWSAIIADRWSGVRRPASAYKVAHHGSHTGHCDAVWSVLLVPDPVTCMTPFVRGSQRLPSDDDKARVKAQSTSSYISSGASRRPQLENHQLKRLEDICKNLKRVESGFGAVRLRKKRGATQWTPELFGAAQAL